jgi:hypothetical protein
MDARLRWTGWSGLAAAAVYIGATAAGSLLDPKYSQIRQHISDLTATGASTWAALVGPYVAYNLLVLAFAFGLYGTSPRGRLWAGGLGLLALNALAGVGMVTWLREDVGGVPTTFAGAGHLVLAGISSLTIVLGSIVFGFAFRRSAAWRPLATFSFAVAVGFATLGPMAAIATTAKSDLVGLAERGPIGLFVVWLLVVAWFSLRRARRPLRQLPSAAAA